MPAHLRASLLRPFAERLALRGGDPHALARRLGIELPAGEEVTYVTAAQIRAFCDEAARLADDPWLGLNAALELPEGWFGMIEVATRSAPTLRDGVQFRVDFAPLLHEGVEVYLELGPQEGRFGFHMPGEPQGLGRHVHEFRTVAAVQSFRRLIGPRFAPLRAWFSHRAPADPEPLAVVLRAPELHFDQPDNGVALSPKDLNRRTRRADPVVFAYWRRQALRRLPRKQETPFATQVRRRLSEQLARGAPDMARLARDLHMSPRTLHRRLASEQLNFQTVLDELRRHIAEREVRQGRLGSAALAERLGYADVPTFLRAFKRWTGMSPTAFRRAEAGPG